MILKYASNVFRHQSSSLIDRVQQNNLALDRCTFSEARENPSHPMDEFAIQALARFEVLLLRDFIQEQDGNDFERGLSVIVYLGSVHLLGSSRKLDVRFNGLRSTRICLILKYAITKVFRKQIVAQKR